METGEGLVVVALGWMGSPAGALASYITPAQVGEGMGWECPGYGTAIVVGVVLGLGVAVVVLVVSGSRGRGR